MSDSAQKPRVIKTDAEWKEALSPLAYQVTRCGGTERAGSGPWLNEKRNGVYVCASCEAPLFKSDTKFESGSGWPSFFDTVDHGAVKLIEDTSHGMRRIEVQCAACEAHLGHVFPDGPKPTGQRYCMNGVALDFKPEG